jgi:signal transduction histidine kinase
LKRSRFSPRNKRITIKAKDSGDSLIISVADEGMGMTQETMDKLFNRFYQADQTIGNKIGTGLGLSICRGIVEAHGDKIWVESTLEKGSVFSFSLPHL